MLVESDKIRELIDKNYRDDQGWAVLNYLDTLEKQATQTKIKEIIINE